MAPPHGDGSSDMGIPLPAQSDSTRPISTVVFVIAMQAEALPLVNKFGLSEATDSPLGKGLPWVLYHGVHNDLRINVVCPGRDAALGIDSVGTVPASLITFASIQALQPDIIVNAGTCGGFKVKGANIGDVFLVSDVVFHDRRIPIPMFDLYGVGLRQAFSTPNLLKELSMKVFSRLKMQLGSVNYFSFSQIMGCFRLAGYLLVTRWICPRKMNH
ncbi:hypothetical protein CARUB_v10005503mg [Capsella rubella]|uniref:Nucleoside phosphorylase domain-containing protein n=1 Tax=Capsella rubella TaxID=81985 RepID=R0GK26_9BRAS|nr:hypothetical protein CARUB_v10005503mg [Capsella rubella]